MLRSRTSRREELLDSAHISDPIVGRADGTNPEHDALLADSVGLRFRSIAASGNA